MPCQNISLFDWQDCRVLLRTSALLWFVTCFGVFVQCRNVFPLCKKAPKCSVVELYSLIFFFCHKLELPPSFQTIFCCWNSETREGAEYIVSYILV